MPFNCTLRTVSWIVAAALALPLASALTGCGVAMLGGAVASGTIAATAGRRSYETAATDRRIQSTIRDALDVELMRRPHHITVNSYYRKVLLTGEVSSERDKARAHAVAARVPQVENIINALEVMPISTAWDRSQDALITSLVKTRFLSTNGIPAASIRVITERGTVYLMGRVMREEAELATNAVQQISGVVSVARAFDLVSAADIMVNASLDALSDPDPIDSGASSSEYGTLDGSQGRPQFLPGESEGGPGSNAPYEQPYTRPVH